MPTVVRSEAMGISSFIAGIGLMLFPHINALVSQTISCLMGQQQSTLWPLSGTLQPRFTSGHYGNSLFYGRNGSSIFTRNTLETFTKYP